MRSGACLWLLASQAVFKCEIIAIAGDRSAINQATLCPCRDDLAKAVMIRREPVRYLNDESIFDYAETLGDSVQSYADVLEIELNR